MVQTLFGRLKLFRNSLLIAGVVFCGVFISAILWISREVEEKALVRLAESYSDAVIQFRSFYAAEIVSRGSGQIEFSHDYRDRPNVLPIPATMTLDLVEYLKPADATIKLAQISDFPFPWRADRALTASQRAALDHLAATGTDKYAWREGKTLHYARAIRMDQACVDCHNSHPDSPKADWKVGDVRAIQVISVDALGLDAHKAGILGIALFVLIGFAAAFGLLFWMDGRVRGALRLAEEKSDAHERARKELEERQSAFDQHAIVSIADRAGRITYANEKFQEISGFKLDELLGQNHRLVKSGLQPREMFEEMWRTISSGHTWNGEICNRAKDGTLYWVAATIVPILDEKGKPGQYISIRTDITERKRIERQIDERQQFLQSLTDALGEGVVAVDTEGRCLFVNPEAERLLGYSRDQLLGGNLHEMVHAHTAEGVPLRAEDCPLHHAMIADEVYRSDTEIFRRADGCAFPISVVAVPLKDSSGTIIGQVSAFDDISQKKEREQELERARRSAEAASMAKSEFLATMSHEIRTPMNGIIGMTSLLLDTELNRDQLHFAATVRSSAEALLSIINDILDFSKMEAGRLDFEEAPFEVLPLVEGVVDILSPRVKGRDIDLSYLVPNEARGVFRSDPGRIRQVLLNLAGNAVKFTEHGSVAILVSMRTVNEGNSELKVAVTDTGIGIPDSARPRLFGMFSQADASTARRYGGTGLGLAICKRIVDLLGGEIGFESEEGKGSSFWFTVPLVRTGLEPSEEIFDGALTDARILVVDDNATNREIFRHQLASWGAVVADLDSATAGLAEIRAAVKRGQPYHVLLLDHLMLGMSGMDLVAVLRGDPSTANLPIILATSADTGGVRPMADALRIQQVLSKPVRQSSLLDSLMNVLGRTPSVRRPAIMEEDDMPLRDMPLRVLVAEDNSVNQQVAVGLLAKLGHRADVADDGAEALELVEKCDYDLVLMDLQMPRVDGLAATRMIRALPAPKSEVAIIAMTANAMAGDREVCLAAGMDDYIAKPIDRRRLAEMLDRWGVRLSAARQARNGGARSAPPPPASIVAPPKEVEAGEIGLIDRNAQQDLCDTLGEDSFVALVESFRGNSGRRIEEIIAAARDGNSVAAAASAHSLKGAASNLGFSLLAHLAAKMEDGAKTGALPSEDEVEALKQAAESSFGVQPLNRG